MKDGLQMARTVTSILVFMLAFAGTEAGVGCGLPVNAIRNPARTRIIGGTWAAQNSHPWLISQNWGGERGHFCGGSLIRVRDDIEATDIVLTAGHCKVVPDGGTWLVNAGQYWQSYSADIQQRNVVKYKRHENYLHFTQNDIMLLKLDKPINFTDRIRPICLPQRFEQLPLKSRCVIAGWGRNQSDDESKFPDIMQQLDLPMHTEQECDEIWGSVFNSSVALCAGPLDGRSATCTADSGGSLVCQQWWQDPNTSQWFSWWVQYGVVSFGVAGTCLQAGYPPVFSRVANYIDWIQNGIKELSSVYYY